MHDVSRNDSAHRSSCAYENTNLGRQSKLGEHDLSRAFLLVFLFGCWWYERENSRVDLNWVGDKNLDRMIVGMILLDKDRRKPLTKHLHRSGRHRYNLLA